MVEVMFRQRLRNWTRDVHLRKEEVPHGSRGWHKLDALERAIAAAHVELFKEAISPLHNGPHPEGEK